MGQAALQPNSEARLPDPITEAVARDYVGDCFDQADWEEMTGGTGSVSKDTFLSMIKVRDHAASLLTWLEFWRIDELHADFVELEIMSPDDLTALQKDTKAAFENSFKVIQRRHFAKAYAHAVYLTAKPLGYMPWRPCSLELWLESWRLMRLLPKLKNLGCDTREDILDLEHGDFEYLDMRLLEKKRWDEGYENIQNLIKTFNFASQRKAAIPTLDTWLKSLLLTKIDKKLEEFGVVELMDLNDMSDKQFKELQLTPLQEKHFELGLNQVKAAAREAMADGKFDLANARSYIESWRLSRLLPQLTELGMVSQQDLLDLDPEDYKYIEMRPLEVKRFEQMLIALEDEFETPPPGEEWTEANMTRRAWRKQNAEQYGYKMSGALRAEHTATKRQEFATQRTLNLAKTQGAHIAQTGGGFSVVSGNSAQRKRGNKQLMSKTR